MILKIKNRQSNDWILIDNIASITFKFGNISYYHIPKEATLLPCFLLDSYDNNSNKKKDSSYICPGNVFMDKDFNKDNLLNDENEKYADEQHMPQFFGVYALITFTNQYIKSFLFQEGYILNDEGKTIEKL